MEKIINFFRNIFNKNEMTKEEEQEIINKIIKKIKEKLEKIKNNTK